MAATIKYLFQYGKKKSRHFVRRMPDDILKTPGHAKYFHNLARVNKSLKTSSLEEALQKYHKLIANFEDRVLLASCESGVTILPQKLNPRPTRHLSEGKVLHIKRNFFEKQIRSF